jgi:hypothetical protein
VASDGGDLIDKKGNEIILQVGAEGKVVVVLE